MRTLLGVEVRRYLARRLTRVLIGLAVLASAVAGIVVFVNAEEHPPEVAAENRARREARVEMCVDSFGARPAAGGGRVLGAEGPPPVGPARARELCTNSQGLGEDDQGLRLTDLWTTGDGEGDSFWGVTSVFLGIGALIGAASMVGAEWKANTFTTLLTWEPRRVRVAVTKLLAAGLLAASITIALQLLFAAALLPTVLLRGTTAGADAEWLRGAAGGLVRSGALAGVGAVIGGSVAMIGRSTAAALGAAFAYLAVVEAIVRAWRPMQARWLIGENATIFLTGRRLEGAPFDRPVALASVTLVAYAVALAAVAAATFRTRDVAA